jgi:hypothetical protein
MAPSADRERKKQLQLRFERRWWVLPPDATATLLLAPLSRARVKPPCQGRGWHLADDEDHGSSSSSLVGLRARGLVWLITGFI